VSGFVAFHFYEGIESHQDRNASEYQRPKSGEILPGNIPVEQCRILNYGILLPLHPKRKKITHITRNKKNKNLAIPADAAAMPPNPNTAATRAIIRKVTAQPNIVFTSFLK